MGLPPLEYIDCFLDSPNFREIINLYEKELEDNAHHVKALVRECKHMIQATEEFSKVQQSFAQVLGNFRFRTIGEQTEDEKMITNSLQTFARLLFNIEDCRHNMLSTISVRLLQTLERFRKDQIQKARDEKKRFDRSSHSYYDALQKHLATSPKKKDMVLADADSSLEREHAGYRQSAFDYVCKLQDVHAQKQYELIEPIIGYISDVSTFLHQAYDSASSIKPELQAVQFKVQILRDTHENEQEKAYQLKAQVIEEGEAGLVHHPEYLRQGNLFVQDSQKKVQIGTQWHRYYCQFRKKDLAGKKIRQVRFLPIGHQGNLPSQDFMEVRDCIRSRSEDVDRRFCFDLELLSLSGTHKYTVQGTSNDSRRGWLEIMEGKEPVYTSLKVLEIGGVTSQGIAFVQRCIDTIETRGLDEEGLYRKPGVISKANKLVKECIEKGKMDQLDLKDEFEWDTKTIASAIKTYLSKQLGEPLLTFTLHSQFVDAGKIPDHEKRLCAIRELCEQLPDSNRKLTSMIIFHLSRVAAMSERNLMKASNLAVCYGPTLMRPERESVASIVDIKYQNIIVEVMILNVEQIFKDSKSHVPQPKTAPPSMPPPPIPTHIKKNSGLVDSVGYQVPGQIGSSTSSEPPPRSNRTSGGNIVKPPPPPIARSSNSTNTISSKGRSPSPEPYEVPLKMTESVERRRPPPPGISTGPPPIPKYKPQVPDAKRRTFIATSPPVEPNHKTPVTRVDSVPTRLSQSDPPTTPKEKSKDNPPLPQAPFRAGRKKNARALYDCQAEDELELSFKKDEILYNVTRSEEPEWLKANRADGKHGLVPANYLEILP